MEMVCNESGDGMKNSKLNGGESERKKRARSNILRKLAELREMKPKPRKKLAVRINMLSKELIPVKKLESVKELETMKRLEEMKNLEEEKELENRKEIEEEVKLEDEKKLEEKKKIIQGMPEMLKYLGNNVIYDRDFIHSYPLQEVQDMKNWAQMAIDVFNKKKAIKYSVVDVIRATRVITIGYIVHLLFTAKPDAADDEDAKTFDANIRCRFGDAEGVTYVDIEK